MDYRKKILIVDDEADILKLLGIRFRANGYEVEVAQDGQEGLDKALQGGYDLIILDISMPKMNGIDVLQRLRSDERTRRTPIVMLTASGDSAMIMKAQELHATDYFGKPFEADELLKFVQRYVDE